MNSVPEITPKTLSTKLSTPLSLLNLIVIALKRTQIPLQFPLQFPPVTWPKSYQIKRCNREITLLIINTHTSKTPTPTPTPTLILLLIITKPLTRPHLLSPPVTPPLITPFILQITLLIPKIPILSLRLQPLHSPQHHHHHHHQTLIIHNHPLTHHLHHYHNSHSNHRLFLRTILMGPTNLQQLSNLISHRLINIKRFPITLLNHRLLPH